MVMIKHSQGTQSNKFAVSLQYIKKEVRDGVHFLHAHKLQSFYKLTLSFLMEVGRHAQSTQSNSVVMQNIKLFYGGLVMFVVTCLYAF